jgi:DNA-binding PadR family transcriptional regulator
MRHHVQHHHHHSLHAQADGHGGRHGGHGGRGGFGFGDGNGNGLPRGRKLSSDDLQLLLLALIAQQPSHGYELIKELERRSDGFYVPSPGMMYPALACMEDQGHVSIQLEGNRKRYALSDEGHAHLEAKREHVDLMLAKLAQAAEKMARMRSAFAGDEAGEGEASGRGWSSEFDDARRALRRALHGRAGASAEEQGRIAAILARAAAEIEAQAGESKQ